MTNESNTFAAWVESPFHMAWRENLTGNELAIVQGYTKWAIDDSTYGGYAFDDVVLIAKLSMMLDTLTRLNVRTEAQRMELLMPHE